MNLDVAIKHIENSFDKMNEIYGRIVFDELAIVEIGDGGLSLQYYKGPRESAFLAEVIDDSISIRQELAADQTSLGGEFSFTRDGDGSEIDAYICLGPEIYLSCNNTEKSMAEVTADPAWLNAQGEFLTLSQLFSVDPLCL